MMVFTDDSHVFVVTKTRAWEWISAEDFSTAELWHNKMETKFSAMKVKQNYKFSNS